MSCANGSLRAATLPVQNEKQTRQLLENCLRQAEQVDYLTAKVASLEKLDKQGKELVAALDQQIEAQERTIAALKAAIAAGTKIEGVDDKLQASLKASLDDAKAQITRLEAKASFWKRAAVMGVMAAVGIGIAIGIAISK